jgi:hypothetical protein
MASSINAVTSGAGGIVTTGDSSGDLNIQSGGVTKIAVTSAGVAVTGLSKASLPTGSVLQVVNATYSTQSSVSNSTPTDTGLTATITPTSASSNILVFVSQTGLQKNSSNLRLQLQLLRNSTVIDIFDVEQLYTADTTGAAGCSSTTYLDSPATISATTYKTQAFLSTGTGIASWCISSSKATITLMEIAA